MMGQIWVVTHSPQIGDWIAPKYARVGAERGKRMIEQHNQPYPLTGPQSGTWYLELLECVS